MGKKGAIRRVQRKTRRNCTRVYPCRRRTILRIRSETIDGFKGGVEDRPERGESRELLIPEKGRRLKNFEKIWVFTRIN